MPFYEYVCSACGAECELLRKISDPPATTCPTCQAEALVKQVSAAGFRLKGGGWYETDFKSDGKRNLVSDEAAKPAEGKVADANPTDAKPAEAKPAEAKPKDAGKSETPAAAKPAAPAKPAAGQSPTPPKPAPAAPSGS